MTRWTVEVTEDGRELRFLFDGKMEQLANVGQTVWTGGEYEKTKRYRHAARECIAALIRDHNRAAAFEVAYDFVYRVANGLLTADVKRAARSVAKVMEEAK